MAFLSRKLFSSYNVEIPKNLRDEFVRDSLDFNLSRERSYSVVLVIWHCLMVLYLWPGIMDGLWNRFPLYKYLFSIHVVAFIYYAINMGIFFYRKKIKRFKSVLFEQYLDVIFIAFTFNWCAVSVWFTSNQLAGYAIGIITLSASLFMSPLKRVLLLITSYFVIVVGTYIVPNEYIVKEQYIVNGAILIICCFSVSRVTFLSHMKSYINQKIIEENAVRLEDAQKILEETVNKRTSELTSTNEKLIQEINMRHEIELQMYKTELENKKKARMLTEAKEYDRIRGDFFANISHELRTPLNIIFCTAQMFRTYSQKDLMHKNKERVDSFIKSMLQNCYRLIRLVNNLIDLTRIDADYIKLNLENDDIIRLIREIVDSTVPYVKSFGITLIFETDLKDKMIACDPDKIERIILNILSNAVKFTLKGGKIIVKIFEQDEYVFIKIKDTGIGIPPNKIDLIFERFQQVDKTFAKKAEGSGIGLSLVKSLVELHGGSISVNSEEGKGSEFTVSLPVRLVEENEGQGCKNFFHNRLEIINIEFSDVYGNKEEVTDSNRVNAPV